MSTGTQSLSADASSGLYDVSDCLSEATLAASLEPQAVTDRAFSTAINLAFTLMQESGKRGAIGRNITQENITRLEWMLARAKAAIAK